MNTGLNKTLVLTAGLIIIPLSWALAQGTAFTYQGRLNAGGNPASGVYDLSFALYDGASGGTQYGAAVGATGVPVTNGLFTVTLDFGSPFVGGSLWLDISVRTNGAGSYTVLSPRQALAPSPYAIVANNARNLLGTLPAAQLSGAIPAGQVSGTVSAAATLTGPLAGDVTGMQTATVVSSVGGQSAANVAAGASAANAATSANAASTLVKRDAAGSFSAGSLSLTGNLGLPATTATSGIIYGAAGTLMHAFGAGNFFAGPNAGNLTLSGTGDLGVGANALSSDTSGYWNTAVGNGALQFDGVGYGNTALGVSALLANTSGEWNTASGLNALEGNTTGVENTAIGVGALANNPGSSQNTADGVWTLYALTNGSGNLALGHHAGFNLTSGNNNIYIGNGGDTNESGVIRLGTPGTHTTTVLAGNVGIGTSAPDARLTAWGGSLGTNAGDTVSIADLFALSSNDDQFRVEARRNTTGTDWSTTDLFLRRVVDVTPISYLRFGNWSVSLGTSTNADHLTVLNNGNVGIGTANPATALDVNGTVTAAAFSGSGAGLTALPLPPANSITSSQLAFDTGSLGKITGGFTENSSQDFNLNDHTIFLRGDQNHGIGWYGGSKPFAGVSIDGPVVFGSTGGALGAGASPAIALAWNWRGEVTITNRLAVGGALVVDYEDLNAGSLSPGITFGPNSGEGIASKRTIGDGGRFGLEFYTASIPRMRINNAGNVGIGTATPVCSLDVAGNIHVANNVGIGTATPVCSLDVAGNIHAANNVGIGTATPVCSLDVAGNIHAANVFVDHTFYEYLYGAYYNLGPSSSADGNTALWFRTTDTPSDQRLKQDIQTIPQAVATIQRLRGVNFHWNETGLKHLTRDIEARWKSVSGKPEDDRQLWEEKRAHRYHELGKTQTGFIAQEVEQVFPDWVTTDLETGFKQINMQQLNAVLVNAIKEQQTEIDSLKERNAAMEQDLTELKGLINKLLTR